MAEADILQANIAKGTDSRQDTKIRGEAGKSLSTETTLIRNQDPMSERLLAEQRTPEKIKPSSVDYRHLILSSSTHTPPKKKESF